MPGVEGGEARQALESEHAALGALLFIAAVESAFQLHQQCALPAQRPRSRCSAARTSGLPPAQGVTAGAAQSDS